MKMSLSLSEAEDLDASRHLKLAIRSGSQEGAPKTRPVFAPVVALSLSNAPPVRQRKLTERTQWVEVSHR